MFRPFQWLLLVLLCFHSIGSYADDDPDFGIAKDIPTYIQEWHIWWGFPYPNTDNRMGHMSANFDQYRESWRLNWDRNGYPLPGLYDSKNLEIVRWQMRCIRATGVDSVAIMIHPDMKNGLVFIQEKDGFLEKILDIAAEEDFQVFFMDEVAFRKGSVSQDPEIMAERVIRFLKKYGNHKGFLKINGEPVYYYQTWGYWVGAEETQKMMAQVEDEVGPVHWMVFGDINKLGEVPQIDDVIGVANIHRYSSKTREWDPSIQSLSTFLARAKEYGKTGGELIYPKFDGTAQPWRTKGVSLYGRGGGTLIHSVKEAMEAKPGLLMFSSWNDWEEGANLEPGWDFDGFRGDPYAYCRAVAKVNGVEFIPPPPPPQSAVHPSIWEKLGYGDGAGPIIEDVRRSHDKGDSLEIVVRDSLSAISHLEIIESGDQFWIASQFPGSEAQGGITIDGGMGESEEVINAFGFVSGNASEILKPTVTFRTEENTEQTLGTATPTIGVVYAFDRLDPIGGLSIKLPRKTPVEVAEPVGAVEDFYKIKLKPAYRSDDVGSWVWDGWQVRTSKLYTPVNFETVAKDGIEIVGAEKRLAAISLLGEPRSERTFRPEPYSQSFDGTRATYYYQLPTNVILEPGLHLFWIRARDIAGNWGSPKLVAIPNFQRTSSQAEPAPPEKPAPEGSVFWDDLNDLKRWNGIGHAVTRTITSEEIVRESHTAIGDSLFVTDIGRELDSSREPVIVRFKMLHTQYSRGGGLMLLNSAGNQGYGVQWDSSKEGQFGGEGNVSILKYDSETPVLFRTPSEPLSGRQASGHMATRRPYAEFEFILNGKTGDLILKVDGEIRSHTKDTSFTRFSKIGIKGNKFILFDDIQVIQ